MAKMNEYPSVDDQQAFTPAQKAAFLGSAMCIATGSKTQNGAKVTANIPLTDITPVVPTKLSDLTDDITVDTYNSTSEAPISGKGVASALANFGGFIVTTIENGKPKVDGTPDQKKIYLTPTGESGTENAYDEWICTDATVPTWEKVGVTRVDLSQYYTKTEADSAFVSKTGYVATENNYTTTEKTKLGDIESGAEVNKINSISIGNTTILPDANKNVNINIANGGLELRNGNLEIQTGTGGLYVDSTGLDIHCTSPLKNVSGDNPGVELKYDDTFTIIDYGNPQEPDEKLAVKNPVPDTDDASNGDVLTYDGATDEIVWAAPASGLPDPTGVTNGYVLTVNNGAASWAAPGGGGGGNPYTKTTLAAQDATSNGHQTSYGTDFYDQSISINNNSYTIVSNVAYATVENPSYDEEYDDEEDRYRHEVVSVENFTINLVQTDFPMAVVEFTLDEKAAVVNIHVNNGVNPLSRMYSTPYVNSLMPDGIDSNGKATLSFDTGTIQAGTNYYYIKGIYSYQLSKNKPSLVTEENADVYTKVQIKIFGDAFTVLTNTYNADIPAS